MRIQINKVTDEESKRILLFLRKLKNYRILKNENVIENLKSGGDIDIYYINNDIKEFKKILYEYLDKPIYIIKRSYVIGFYYNWGHIDYQPSLEWWGFEFLDKKDLLKYRVNENGIKIVDHEVEAIICWLLSLLWGGFFKEKYRNYLNSIQKNSLLNTKFKEILNKVLGKKFGNYFYYLAQTNQYEKSEEYVNKIRMIIVYKSIIKNPIKSIKQFLKFLYYELKLRIFPPMPWIAILGIDGSGKSSIIDKLKLSLIPSIALNLEIYHWRPNLIFKQKKTNVVTNPHAANPRSKFVSFLKLNLIIIDWFIGYLKIIVPNLIKRNIVIFDRFYADILVDPKRYRYNFSKNITSWVMKLLPKPNIIFFIKTKPELAYQRKMELDIKTLDENNSKYLELKKLYKERFKIIENNNELLDSIKEIEKEILNYFKQNK